MVSMLLDVDEEHLEFVLDVFSGNPYRIFKCLTSNPKVDLATIEITADFYQPRLGMIADVLECKKKQVKKLAAIWIHSYDLVYRGEQYIKMLGTEILNIDPMFFFFLVKKCDKAYQKTHHMTKMNLSESIRKFLDIHFQRIKRNLENNAPKEAPFFNNLKTEEHEEVSELNSLLRNVADNNPINDSPFTVKKGRTMQDVFDFITILD